MHPSLKEQHGAISMQTVAIGAVALIALASVVYFWPSMTSSPDAAYDTSNEAWMAAPSNSDDAAAIQAELEATNMTEFETNMKADAEATASGI